jgi:hypothetical protein
MNFVIYTEHLILLGYAIKEAQVPRNEERRNTYVILWGNAHLVEDRDGGMSIMLG